jgi:hypothetical protein
MNTIATLYRLREHLGFASDDTAEDSRLRLALAATTLIQRYAGRQFMPRHATLAHSVTREDSTCLLLTDDLLALTSVTNGDGSPIAPEDMQVLAGSRLALLNGAAFNYDTTPVNAIDVTGIWGWHDDWAQAWIASCDTVQNNPLSSSATTLTVADSAGADANGQTPRFQVGQLLRIEAEYVRVTAVNTATHVLTIQRGANGTTAASHTQNTAIAVYCPPRDAEILCLRVAAWLYQEPNTVNGNAIPPMLRPMLDTLRRPRL